MKTRRVFDRRTKTTAQRSLGFAFVTFASPKDAQSVVSALNDKDHEGRPLKVEIARPEEPREKKEEDGEAKEEKPKAARKTRRRSRRATDEEAEEGAEEGEEAEANGDAKPKAAGRRRRPSAAAARPKAEKPSLEGRPQSKTQVFVSNLPFSVNSDQLNEFFTSKGLKVAESQVISRRLRSGAERSKGFGFVTFQSEADQQKAVNELSGAEFDGRKINVRVAVERAAEEAAAEAGEQ